MYKYYKEIKSGSSFGNNNNSDNKRYCYYRVDEDSECRHPILYISKSNSGIIIKSISGYEFLDIFEENYASGRMTDSNCEEFEEALMTSLISLNIGVLK